jgi:hypothetical protein
MIIDHKLLQMLGIDVLQDLILQINLSSTKNVHFWLEFQIPYLVLEIRNLYTPPLKQGMITIPVSSDLLQLINETRYLSLEAPDFLLLLIEPLLEAHKSPLPEDSLVLLLGPRGLQLTKLFIHGGVLLSNIPHEKIHSVSHRERRGKKIPQNSALEQINKGYEKGNINFINKS